MATDNTTGEEKYVFTETELESLIEDVEIATLVKERLRAGKPEPLDKLFKEFGITLD